MNGVPENSGDVSKYCFYVWDSQAMKAIDTRSNESSSKYISEQEQKEADFQSEDVVEIVEVPLISTLSK